MKDAFPPDTEAPLEETPPMTTITVYCGSRPGHHPDYMEAAEALGAGMARRGINLAYGGGNVGLMGAVADAVLAGGGEVYGVMPKRLVDREIAHKGLTRLEIVDSMHERKQRMIDAGDAYIALPGGIGTLEEIIEVLSWRNIGYFRKPVGFLNRRGVFDLLLAGFEAMIHEGFILEERFGDLVVEADPETLLDRLTDPARGRSGTGLV
jgi:uncharacterized protein (TIGR00730 family)